MEYYVSGGQAYQPDQLAHWLVHQCFGIKLARPAYISPFAAYPAPPQGELAIRLRQLKHQGKEVSLNHEIRIRNVSNRGGDKLHYFALPNRRLIVYHVTQHSYTFQYYFEGFVHQHIRQGGHLLNYTNYAPQPAQPNDLEQITKAIYHSFAYLPGETANRLRAMLTPEAIAGIAGFAALYLASQVTPIGWIANALGVGLFVWGVWVMGSEILEAAKLLKAFYQTATNSRTESDYQKAGKYFAQAVSLIGVDTLMLILGNKAMNAAKPKVIRIMKGGSGEAPGSGRAITKIIEKELGQKGIKTLPTVDKTLKAKLQSTNTTLSELPKTGIERFDKLATQTKEYKNWVDNVSKRGYEVIEKPLAPGEAASIFPEKMLIEVDPQQFRYIDLLHESRHFAQLDRAVKAGVLKPQQMPNKMMHAWFEKGAYEYELKLSEKYGFSEPYKDFLKQRIDDYWTKSHQNKLNLSKSTKSLYQKIWK